ncbi:TetR/AcrR family transcriptional regulator [Marinomonas colpomeniae]|uniref:TetR family transcriptional regulator n=1 Tax=Marinomonas colpomeniae TaxID=2774408 RepID=A0ABR8P3M6_9GAMM|nr:TetR/AcrR family transcriptional regulator [Marinomonas colpomeniae]MBD5771947.1 TetR family transcriptional regulator [Marinomonas colpomeniae]
MSKQSISDDKSLNSIEGKRAKQARLTKSKILKSATKVFAEDGFSGGRIERISREANSNDRMIYYYFGNKESLFLNVLEATYLEFYKAEKALDLDIDSPIEALESIIEFTFRYYLDHPEFVAILNDENLHRAKHSRQSENIKSISGNIQGNLAPLLKKGQKSGVFRKEVTARNLYLTISALTYFYCSNQHTLTVFVGANFQDASFQSEWLKHISDVVIRSVIIDI